ncbi:MAG: hypothetical protein EP329_05015 [Deltaproteobacteria bacterium]|nr:MAG: hypothetical protein EP329_05015 [Deltaproteobacteria bacterium]
MLSPSRSATAAPPLVGALVAPDALEIIVPHVTPEVREEGFRVVLVKTVGTFTDGHAKALRASLPEVAKAGPRAPLYDPPTEEERRIVEYAMYHCDNAAARYAKPFVMLELIRVEEDYGIPDELRGVTLAAWCSEAAYQLDAVVGDGGSAIGILQLHPQLASLCGNPDLRHDPIASAQCWLWNLRRIYDKASRRCRPKRAWKAAELWLSQGGQKSGYSCKRVSSHVARLEQWHRGLAREQQVASARAKR